MVLRTVLSDPKPSTRFSDYLWFYYDYKTPQGQQCGAMVPRSVADIVRRGFQFDSNALVWEDSLGCRVLTLDFNGQAPQDPSLPPNPEFGWGDPDHIGALEAPAAVVNPRNTPAMNAAARRAAAAEASVINEAQQKLAPELLELLEQMARSYNYLRTRIGAKDPPRSDHARAMAITATIAWSRLNGMPDPTMPPGSGEELAP